MQFMILLSSALRRWSPPCWFSPQELPPPLRPTHPASPIIQPHEPVRFELHISSGPVDAIGTGPRDAILINGTFVGPTLRLTQGDDVEFLVRNYLVRDDTTVHFHGISQRTTPWSDGVPGLTQRPIRPGASYLYRWTAEDAGTYFYHAHSRGQLMDGLYGAIIIEASPAATTKKQPFHLLSRDAKEEESMRAAERLNQPLLMADWSQQYKFADFYRIEAAANFDLACTDAIIVNGMGSQYCLDDAAARDKMTNPVVLHMLQHLPNDDDRHMTEKGCVPPIQALQGDFDVDTDKLPPHAVRKCAAGGDGAGGGVRGGVRGGRNFTFSVDARLGWAALTFINVGGLYPLQVAMDNHELHVYAVDGQYVRPTAADQVYVGNGNRVSVLVRLDQEPARYTIRVANALLNQILGGFAEMVYGDAAAAASGGATAVAAVAAPRHPKPKMNYAGQPLISGIRSFRPEEGRPYPERRPARYADRTVKLVLRKPGRPHGAYEWSLSGHEVYNMTAEEQDPPMLFHPQDRSSSSSSSELVVSSQVGDWVDIILETEGPFAQSHPAHKHGNKVYFLGSGIGRFPWADVEEAARRLPAGSFNVEDPAYLDTFTTPDIAGEAPAVWTAVRYQVESAGAWLMHCHVQTHQAGGMGVVLLDGVDRFPEVPLEYREWNGFSLPA